MTANKPTRCNPGNVKKLIAELPKEAIARIRDLGFSNLLQLNLDGLGNRRIYHLLLDKSKVHKESIEIQVKDGVSLWITKEVLQHVLDLPVGSIKKLSESETDSETTEYNRMYTALKWAAEKLKTKDTKAPAEHKEHDNEEEHDNEDAASEEGNEPKASEKRNYFSVTNIKELARYYRNGDNEISEHVDTDMIVRLFFGVVLEKFLLPAASLYVTARTLAAVYNLDQLRDIDWSYLVFEHLKKSCVLFATDKTQMYGCVVVLMVVFADCMVKNRLEIECSCRINVYTSSLLKELYKTAPKKKLLLENFQLVNWENSVYKKFAVVHEQDNGQSSCNKSNHDDTIDAETVYKMHVLERTRDKFLLDFECYCEVQESIFVDCFKPRGRMHSLILHLVCHLWSTCWNDKIILGEAAVNYLLTPNSSAACLNRELTAEKVKQMTQIFIPIVSNGHWSLVKVSTLARKIYILDSCPGMHETVVQSLLTNLQTYLQNTHNMDISGYDEEKPEVQHQKNNHDCGYHVLLYILRFGQMEMSKIDTEQVLELRKELSKFLLYHEKNRKRPNRPQTREGTCSTEKDDSINSDPQILEDTQYERSVKVLSAEKEMATRTQNVSSGDSECAEQNISSNPSLKDGGNEKTGGEYGLLGDKISAADSEKATSQSANQLANQPIRRSAREKRSVRFRTVPDQTVPKKKPRKEPPNETVLKIYNLAIECTHEVAADQHSPAPAPAPAPARRTSRAVKKVDRLSPSIIKKRKRVRKCVQK